MTGEMNILLVEDNKLDAMFVVRALSKVAPKATLTHAQDGNEALELVRARDPGTALSRPFFVLLDINMPRMNGHEFLKELRRLDEGYDSIVFMFTTSDSPQDISTAYRNGVNGYIVKPHSSKDLKEVLGTLQRYWAICEPPLLPPVCPQPA